MSCVDSSAVVFDITLDDGSDSALGDEVGIGVEGFYEVGGDFWLLLYFSIQIDLLLFEIADGLDHGLVLPLLDGGDFISDNIAEDGSVILSLQLIHFVADFEIAFPIHVLSFKQFALTDQFFGFFNIDMILEYGFLFHVFQVGEPNEIQQV